MTNLSERKFRNSMNFIQIQGAYPGFLKWGFLHSRSKMQGSGAQPLAVEKLKIRLLLNFWSSYIADHEHYTYLYRYT